MAFENPFLRQSSVRQSALDYLFSDEPEGDSVQAPTPSNSFADTPVVDQAFGVSENNATIGSIAANIAANEGSYNAEVGTSIAPMGAVETMNTFSKYGSVIKGVAQQMGIPSGFIGLAQQSVANTIDAQMATMGGVTSGQNNLGLTGMGVAAGMLGGPLGMLAGLGLGALGKNSDTMANTAAFAGNFTTQAQMDGYISAASNPAMQTALESLIENPTTITPAQYGTLGSSLNQGIQDAINQGYTNEQAVSIAATNMGVAPDTAANINTTDPLGQLAINLGAVPAPPPTSSTSSVADASGVSYGGVVSDSSGQAVTTSNGGGLGFGDGGVNAGDGGYGSGEVGYDAGDMGHGGGGGNSGKIVCTAMNESYGFGAFRNRIWLTYAAKNLTKAHEVGYHTLFLPLVDLAYKKNIKPLRAVLENIARHRSADLRAEMRGSKRDSIGRTYRAFLEPLCYAVGKLKGF